MSGVSPPGIVLSETEAQGFQALGNFIQSCLTPYPIAVVRQLGSTAPGVNVRVPEPAAGDFVVMSSLRDPRIEWTETRFTDTIAYGGISGTTLTVYNVPRGTLAAGQLLTDYQYPNGQILTGTTIVVQISSEETDGSPGGTGTYLVSQEQNLAAQTLYAGTRADHAARQWTVQLDVHGPNSTNNVRTFSTLFFTEVAVNYFADAGLEMAPLFIDDRGQIPFENAEQEIEYRWVIEANFQVTPVVTTPQMFADTVDVTIEVPTDLTNPAPPPEPPVPPGVTSFYLPFSVPSTFMASMTPSPFDGNYEFFDVTLPVTVTFPSGLTTSEPFTCFIAPLTTVILTLQSIQGSLVSPIGSIMFAPGETTATVNFAGAVLLAGSRFRMITSFSADETIAGISGTIVGLRPT